MVTTLQALLISASLIAFTANANNDIEYSFGIGLTTSNTELDPIKIPDIKHDHWHTGLHLSFGGFRNLNENHKIGFRIDRDDVQGYQLLSFRAVDYQYRINKNWNFGAFWGAAEFDFKRPMYGWYFGTGLQWQPIPNSPYRLLVEYHHHDTLQRDKVFGENINRSDIFIHMHSFTFSLRYQF